MIHGCKKWDDRSTFSVQTNNGVESLIRAWSGKDRSYLETCGPTAAINVLDAMAKSTQVLSPTGEKIQPEDFLTLWMNDPKNQHGAAIDRPANEYPQLYPEAISRVFGQSVRFLGGQTFDWIASIVSGGVGCMICLVDPGHFLAVVAYDDVTHELIYRDPWPNRTGTDGFNLRMGRAEYESNVKPYVLVFGS